MAHDWIKMRTGIDRDPRVIAMAEQLASTPEFARHLFGNTSREQNETCSQTVREQFGSVRECLPNVRECSPTVRDCFSVFQRNIIVKACVSALLTVWGVVRDQGKDSGSDARLDVSTLRTLDHIAELPGFGEAMARVGWVRAESEDQQNHLIFPGFLVENRTKSGKGGGDRSEYQKAYRARKKAEREALANSANTLNTSTFANSSQTVSDSSRTVSNQNETVEKTQNRREENKEEKDRKTLPTPSAPELLDAPILPVPQNTPAETPTPKPKPEPKPRARNELFDAVCDVTGSLPTVNASHIQKICTAFKNESPPITPAEVREFGRRFHELCPWAATGDSFRPKPNLGELQKHVGKLRTQNGTGIASRLGRVDSPPGKYDGFDCSGSVSFPPSVDG